MSHLRAIQAGEIVPIGGELPREIVFLPEGEHHITPSVNGKPGKVIVRVLPSNGPTIAATLQRDLDRRFAENVRPHLDFDHRNEGPAAALPMGFRYQQGTGVMLAVDWTRSGKAAIEGRDFSYFSPVFLMGDDNIPSALPRTGAIGALVNEPAFRTIPRIAARDESESLWVQSEEHPFLCEARAMVLDRRAPSVAKAYAIIAREKPALYDDYHRSLFDGRAIAASERMIAARKTETVSAGHAQGIFSIESARLIRAGVAKSYSEAVRMIVIERPDLYDAYCTQFAG